ncbi:MAG: FtsX-like permease family protein [Spirochaetales bacterium]|nr:FtsX-like permease family protein [Spirochaetales bacterium]
MLFTLAIRNILRGLGRLSPIIVSIVLVFAVLILGNAVLTTMKSSLYTIYAEQVAGDLTVSPKAETNFTIFGSDQLLVGELLVPPTLVDFEELEETAGGFSPVAATAGLVTGTARVEIGGNKKKSTVLGVDFRDYTALLDAFELVSGRLPEAGEPGMLVQEGRWENPVGWRALLASGSQYTTGRNFTLREAPVTGTFRYPVREQALESIVLADADTVRALNGYTYGGSEAEPVPEEDREELESDFSSMFGEEDRPLEDPEDTEPEDDAAIDPNALFSGQDSGTDKEEKPAAGSAPAGVDSGAWNFLLISLENRSASDQVAAGLAGAGYTEEAGYLLRNWRSSVGGNAQLAWYLQVVFNIGLLFVSLGAAIIATNSLLLSVLERTGEIGTLRAVGATRGRIALMVFVETLLIVVGSAAVGILLGWVGVLWLNGSELVLDNRYVNILFGGKPVQGQVSVSAVVFHLGAACLLAGVSMLYPIRYATKISPVQAMAE